MVKLLKLVPYKVTSQTRKGNYFHNMEQSWNVAPKESFQISKSNAIPLHDSNIGEPNLLSKDNAFSSEIKYLDNFASIRYRNDNLS